MWTTDLLQGFFERQNISPRSYSFYGDKDDAVCLEKVGPEWLVYYSERGQKRDLGWGKSESQALEIMKLFVLEASGKSNAT